MCVNFICSRRSAATFASLFVLSFAPLAVLYFRISAFGQRRGEETGSAVGRYDMDWIDMADCSPWSVTLRPRTRCPTNTNPWDTREMMKYLDPDPKVRLHEFFLLHRLATLSTSLSMYQSKHRMDNTILFLRGPNYVFKKPSDTFICHRLSPTCSADSAWMWVCLLPSPGRYHFCLIQAARV